MTLMQLYLAQRLATLGDVCAALNIHPEDAREWAMEHGVSMIHGEYVFTRAEAYAMARDFGIDVGDEEILDGDEDGEVDPDDWEGDDVEDDGAERAEDEEDLGEDDEGLDEEEEDEG